MTFNAKKAGNADAGDRIEQPIIEAGMYPARLVQLIDLGVQAQRAFQGQPKAPMQEIMLTYELVDVFMLDADGNEQENKPRWVSETLPFHNLKADKAKSTQRYNAFDPKGDWDGDFSKAVGAPINVVLVNNVVGDKTYTNVAGVATMRARDAAACPEPQNPVKMFSLDEPDMEVFGKLPKWVQEKIQKNLNYGGSALERALKGGGTAKPKPAAQKPAPADDADDGDNNPY